MWLLKISFLNLLRNSKRTIVTLLIIALGNAAIMLIGGFGLFTYQSLAEQTARDTGHFVVSHKDFFEIPEDSPLQLGVENYTAIVERLEQLDAIKYVLPSIEFQGLVSHGDKSLIFLGRGIDVDEIKARGPFMTIIAGDSFAKDIYKAASTTPSGTDDERDYLQSIPPVLVGQQLAKNLGAKVGSVITLLSNTSEGSLNGFDAIIKGIVTTGIPQIDERLVITKLEDSQTLLATQKVSRISLHLYKFDDDHAMAFEQQLQNDYQDMAITHWEALAPFYNAVKSLYNNIFGFIGSIVCIIVFFTVFNSMNMAVWERTKEIGTINALGASQKEIIVGFVWEGVYVSIAASLLAVIITVSVSVLFAVLDIQMDPPPGRTSSYPLQINISWVLYTMVALFTLAISIIAAVASAKQAAKMPIVDALAHA